RTSVGRSWSGSSAPIPMSWGCRSRRRAGSWPTSACESARPTRLDRLLQGLEVKHRLGARDPEPPGQRRVGPDDPDRLLEPLGRDEPVGQMASARGLEPRLELFVSARDAAREPRGELLGAGRTHPLLGGEERLGEGREVDVRRATIGADEDGGVHRLHSEGARDRRGRAEVAKQCRAPLLEEAGGHRLVDERGVDLAGVDRTRETASAHTHEMELRDTDAGAGQQPAEPGELGRARCRHADAEPRKVLDRPHGAGPLTASVSVWSMTMSPSTGSAPRRLARRRRTPGPPRDHVKARLVRLYEALERRFGPQRWWPGRTAYEVAVGAVLTQHTAWTNAAHAVAALRALRLLRPRRLAALGEVDRKSTRLNSSHGSISYA